VRFTDLFLRRPVLAVALSLAILVVGLRAGLSLPVREFPATTSAVVTVSTVYTGADASLVAGFITTPLENSIAQADGIDYLTSSSVLGQSTIKAYLRLDHDADKALTEIQSKVSAVRNQLPPGAQEPALSISTGDTIDAMYLGFSSTTLSSSQITDYLLRVVQPQLQAVPGVQTAEILGPKRFALRAWLDPEKLAAYSLTATDVQGALAANDYLAAVGSTRGRMVQIDLVANTGLHSLEEFQQLIVKSTGGRVVRLGDVAHVTLGSEDYDSQVSFDGRKAVYVGIQAAPAANLLEVARGVRKAFESVHEQLPQGLDATVVYDSTVFVSSSLREVATTLAQAFVIVTAVVLIFLGSARAAIIPTVAVPLSLVGTLAVMLALGYTINLLTLLALVLAIGLVVDDAIIVVENVARHVDAGSSAATAALEAARELAGPILAMTVVLFAVYLPVGLMGGLTGALFSEFAFTLAAAVAVSAVVALTLSPLMSARLLSSHGNRGARPRWTTRLQGRFDRAFDALRSRYARSLALSLDARASTYLFAVIVLGSLWLLVSTAQKELAPQEDQGVVIASATYAPTATLEQKQLYGQRTVEALRTFPETAHVFQILAPGVGVTGQVLAPWDRRERTSNELQPLVQQALTGIAGARIVAFQRPSLPGANGLPIQFVLKTTDPFDRLAAVSSDVLARATASGRFGFLDSDLKYDMPQTTVVIDREMAAQLGLTLKDVGAALSGMLGGGYVNYFGLDGRSYQVIAQAAQQQRLNAEQLGSYYIRAASGMSVRLSTLVSLRTSVAPESLNRFQQQNAAILSGVPAPGVTQGEALDTLRSIAATLPEGYSIDYAGPSRQLVAESDSLLLTFVLALIVVYLALAALFESFRDPAVILISVPMSMCGALLFVNAGVGGATLNIYTEVGLLTLMGLVSKHGILMVQFANERRAQGAPARQAVEHAAAVRFRPILMTTAAMVLGVLPLLIASGAGAASRFAMGLVIASGLSIGTLFTLYVVPAMYVLLARPGALVVAPEMPMRDEVIGAQPSGGTVLLEGAGTPPRPQPFGSET
jgi:multidrug efflux pump